MEVSPSSSTTIFHYVEADETILEIPWTTKGVGKLLLGVVFFAIIILAGIQWLDGNMWGWGELFGNVGALGLIAYVGTSCIRNRTFIRLKSDGTIHVSYGPLPLMPGSVVNRDEVHVDIYWNRTHARYRIFWRVVLLTSAGKQTPLTVGGLKSEQEAKEQAEQIRGYLGISWPN